MTPRMARPVRKVAPLQEAASFFGVEPRPLPSWVKKGITVLPCQLCFSMKV